MKYVKVKTTSSTPKEAVVKCSEIVSVEEDSIYIEKDDGVLLFDTNGNLYYAENFTVDHFLGFIGGVSVNK